ncbi:hypothetical protein [Collimonas sp.]|jgi:hypothetical protein|uniref:hypothetical protein n=1 Tax=Collimonas sp. TaxID=1963772 RepID=UPI0037C0ACE4
MANSTFNAINKNHYQKSAIKLAKTSPRMICGGSDFSLPALFFISRVTARFTGQWPSTEADTHYI